MNLTKLLIVCLAPLLLAAQGIGPMGAGGTRVVGGGGGGGATDFTEDDACVGAYLLTTAGTETGHETNQCDDVTNPTIDAAPDVVWQGGTGVFAATAPLGSASGQDAVDIVAGTDEHFTGDDSAGAFDGLDALTFTTGCWMQKDLDGTETLMSKNDSGSFEFITRPSGVIRARHVSGANIDSPTAAAPQSSWVHVVMRYDGDSSSADAADDTIELFVNGDPAASAASTDGVGVTSDFVIGANQNGGTDFDGRVMECFFFDRILTADEIDEIVLLGLDGTADGTTRDANYGNDSCTGAGTPWEFCTGTDTGTGASCSTVSC